MTLPDQASIPPNTTGHRFAGRNVAAPRAFNRRMTLSVYLTAVLIGWLSGIVVPAASRAPWLSNRVMGSPNPPAPYAIQRVLPGLQFDRPVDVAPLPGSDRLLVLEQGGKLVSFRRGHTTGPADPVFDFRAHHQPFDSAYAFTFHPRFLENRYVFVCYAEPGVRENGSYISRFTMSRTDPPTLDPASERVILRWLSGGHNGCTVVFGNDGFLYISTGDAANPDPPDMPFRTGQDISDLLASVLRIDVDRTEGDRAYAIPTDNPFRDLPGARPEVYAFGFRNPWRMSIDRATGDLWLGDVGWEQWEMIYRVRRGGNYGWSITEGPNPRVRTDVARGPGEILPPMVSLPHSDAASITGGVVYRGTKLPNLRGGYIYGDWETGKFWDLRHEGDRLVSNTELCDTALKPVSFTLDHDGELLFLDYNGGLYTLVPNEAPTVAAPFPRRLSETGLFADLGSLAPSPGVERYRINAPMWNDLARADHVVGIPGDEAIATANGRETIAGRMWHFPSNTVFARTLTLEMEQAKAPTARKIETQLLHFDGQAWNPYTFRWNPAQTDADLVPAEGAHDTFAVIDSQAPGGRREIAWRFLGRAECMRCHNVWAGETLSFNWMQLNTRSSPTELDRLADAGLLRIRNAPAPRPQLADPYDSSLPLADRARSWLHVNCAGCHRFGAGGDVPSQFNFDQPIENARVLDARPVRGEFGLLAARVVAPGDPHRSVLFYRVNTEGSGHMPHIGTRLADEQGIRLLRDWITSLPPSSTADGPASGTGASAAEIQSDLARLTSGDRLAAIARLLGTMNGNLALLNAPVTPALREEIAAWAAAHTNALTRDLFQRWLPPDQRRDTLGPDFDPRAVLALTGNPERGRHLFFGVAQCGSCHVSGGTGRAFGPDLSAIGSRYDRTQMLDQLLAPSRVIAPEYKTTVIMLRDGEEISGFVKRRSTDEIVLVDAALSEQTVRPADIKEMKESLLSAMPEGLLAPLTAQEAADLLAFLTASRATP